MSRLPSWGIEALFPVCQPHNRHYIRCDPPTLALRSGLIFSYESVACGSAARNWTSNFASNWASNFASNWASNFASNWANDEGQGRQSCGDPVNIEHCSGQIPRVSVAVTPAPRSRQAVEKGKRKQAADEASNADWAKSKSRADPAFEANSQATPKDRALPKTHCASHTWLAKNLTSAIQAATKLLICVGVSSPRYL